MKIETLTNLIGGELINRPFISEVVHFTNKADEVNRGSCFFASNKEDIKKAVENGAYAIILMEDYPIIDREIAWIKVKDFKKAVFNLFKYENLKSKIYFTDKITSMLIKNMNNEKNVIVIEDEFEDLLKALNLNKKYLVTYKKEFLENFVNIENIASKDINLIQKTVFKSFFNNHEINMPYVYKENFSKALYFFESNDLKYTIEFELERFKPIFINSNFEEVEYGKSEKVLITGIKNDEFLIDELNYVIENTKHAKTVLVDKYHKKYLKEKFNFAVLIDFEIELKQREEKGLFDD